MPGDRAGACNTRVHSYRGTAAARGEEGSGQRAATRAGEGNEPRAAAGQGGGERAAVGQGGGERAAAGQASGERAAAAARAHQGAVADVLRATDRSAITSFTRSAARAVAMRQFSAIIVELNTDLDGFPADLNRYYRRCPQMLLSGVPAAWFRPVTGARARPAWVWLPDGRGSCAAVARLLDGYGAFPAAAQSRRPAPWGGAS